MYEVMITAVVFFAIYHIVSDFTSFLLKRKIIKSGHFEKAEILETSKITNATNENKYPSLKWGLVAFFAGMGFVIIEVIRMNNPKLIDLRHGVLAIGIELVGISLGFLIYFLIMHFSKKD